MQCSGLFLNAHEGMVTGVATILLMAITALLSAVAFAQYRTTRAQLRAYVDLSTVQLEKNPSDINAPWGIHVMFKNYGATPARDVIVTTDTLLEPSGMRAKYFNSPKPPIRGRSLAYLQVTR
jgi:hypothetical protein